MPQSGTDARQVLETDAGTAWESIEPAGIGNELWPFGFEHLPDVCSVSSGWCALAQAMQRVQNDRLALCKSDTRHAAIKIRFANHWPGAIDCSASGFPEPASVSAVALPKSETAKWWPIVTLADIKSE